MGGQIAVEFVDDQTISLKIQQVIFLFDCNENITFLRPLKMRNQETTNLLLIEFSK